jgi:hypothetical protein
LIHILRECAARRLTRGIRLVKEWRRPCGRRPLSTTIFSTLNALLHPGTIFEHPKYVLAHPLLSLSEKRAILASWASDASAIASCLTLRALDGLQAPVTIDEILEALCELDGGPRDPPGGKPNRLYSTSRALAA